MIYDIEKNIDVQIGMLREISTYYSKLDGASSDNKKFIEQAIESMTNNLKHINAALPELIANTTFAKPLGNVKKPALERVELNRQDSKINVVLKKGDRDKFIKELGLTEEAVHRMRDRKEVVNDKEENFKKASGYLKLSNKVFLDKSREAIAKGNFKELRAELNKANIDVLFQTYVSMMFFTTLLSFFAGLFLVLIFTFVGFEGIVNASVLGYITRAATLLWIPIVLPALTFFLIYVYPSTEKGSAAKKIDRELPFAVIHMSAISGAGIEPSEIFKIIGKSDEYPALRREIRKIMNQLNVYGYDLVTSLNNVSKSTPSQKLAELLAGISTTIGSGGDLSDFFAKRAESLLNLYRLEREKYTKIAETFMNIYISVVIAAPMILMLLLIIIKKTNMGAGIGTMQLTAIIVALIALANIFSLWILQAKQPSY